MKYRNHVLRVSMLALCIQGANSHADPNQTATVNTQELDIIMTVVDENANPGDVIHKIPLPPTQSDASNQKNNDNSKAAAAKQNARRAQIPTSVIDSVEKQVSTTTRDNTTKVSDAVKDSVTGASGAVKSVSDTVKDVVPEQVLDELVGDTVDDLGNAIPQLPVGNVVNTVNGAVQQNVTQQTSPTVNNAVNQIQPPAAIDNATGNIKLMVPTPDIKSIENTVPLQIKQPINNVPDGVINDVNNIVPKR